MKKQDVNYDEMKVKFDDKLIDQKIKEIHDYFVNKIMDGDYELITFSGEHTIAVRINKKYYFIFFLTDIARQFQVVSSLYIKKNEVLVDDIKEDTPIYTLINLNFTIEQKQELHERFWKYFEEHILESQIKDLRQKIDNLQKNYKP